MFRKSRRKHKEISEETCITILKEERIGILAVNGDDGYPYAIPLNYYYDEDENKIFFHGARVGHKVDSIKKCDKVCFTVRGPEEVRDEIWAPYVKSVVIFGRCHMIEEPMKKESSLRKMAMKYYPDETLMNEEIQASGKAVQMFEIKVEHMSGKEIQKK